MKTIDYRNVVLVEEWAALLQQIFDNAEEAVRTCDAGQIALVQEQIRVYVKKSPSKCSYLDDIAQELARDLYDAQSERSLAAIGDKQRQLVAAVALVRAATDENRGAKDALMLTELRERVAAAADMADALRDAPSNRDVSSVLAEIDALRQRLAGA